MALELSQNESKVFSEVHDLLVKETTPDVAEEIFHTGGVYGGPKARKVIQKVGARGWLCPSWPKKYGGIESSELLRFKIVDDMAYLGLPYMFIGAHMAGPLILKHASEELKDEFLPVLAKGNIEICLGYTEPQAGSDLASLEIRAEDKGDYFLINGQKMFNTSAHIADYHWLAARTDPNAPKHKGITLMIVDLKTPGITIRPMVSMAGWKTNEVFYDNVQVPKYRVVGELNKGFYYIMTALDYERAFVTGAYRRVFDDLAGYVKTASLNGKLLSKDPIIRQQLAELAIELEVAHLLYYRLADMLDHHETPSYEPCMEKLFGTELTKRVTNTAMQIMGPAAQLLEGTKGALLGGAMQHHYLSCIIETVYGGTSEIMRNIMALRGLGLPAR